MIQQRTYSFRASYLAMLVSLCMSPATFALQELSDTSLSESTGEGVALVLDNFKMVFQGSKDLSAGSSYARGLVDPGQYDTGFIRLVPTGENYQSLYDSYYAQKYTSDYQTAYQTAVTNNDLAYTSKYNEVKNDTTLYNSKYTEFYNSNYANYEKAEIDKYWDRTRPTNTYQVYYNARVLIYGAAETERMTIAKIKQDKPVVADATAKVVTDTKNWIENEAVRQAQLTYKDPVREANLVAVPTASSWAVNQLQQRKTKADVFIYGLALSKSDNDLSSRFSNQGFNWGSADNPWLVHAGTAEKVRQFTVTEKDVGYIAIEAPLMSVTPTEADNNIKLGFWADIFARGFNTNNAVDPITGGPTGGLDQSERLRLQFIANGLSLNGSQVRLFQTLPSSILNYSETLGLASLIRLNTNDRPENLTNASADLNAKGIRISTAARDDDSDGVGPTPALNNSVAPLFNPVEGLYLYSPNINLVLGNMYQPFIVGSEGNNIILEVTRIPDIKEIYTQIYQNYGGGLGSSELQGSTCNVYQCGMPIKNHNTDLSANYQGRSATHSSISIGSVERIPGTNLLRAKDINSTGVVFKSPTGDSVNLGSVAIDGVLIQHLKIKTTGL
ncbi:hypothetical protein [Acinetobacter thermotolerans]|uniref:hypothetical protein n=1 Tax=Acinetobacter thermotolerans TaxID=3151487 RepID=UPI00325B5944